MRQKFTLLMILASVLCAACASFRIPKGQEAYVDIAPNGVITFGGAPVSINELPARLKSAGANSETPIYIVAEKPGVSAKIVRSTVTSLNRAGYFKVLIQKARKATVSAGGETVEATIAEVGADNEEAAEE